MENGSDRSAPHARELWAPSRHDAARQPATGAPVPADRSVSRTVSRALQENLTAADRRRRVERPMTSLPQIDANRHTAFKSTGPNTEAGKRRSRRHAERATAARPRKAVLGAGWNGASPYPLLNSPTVRGSSMPNQQTWTVIRSKIRRALSGSERFGAGRLADWEILLAKPRHASGCGIHQ